MKELSLIYSFTGSAWLDRLITNLTSGNAKEQTSLKKERGPQKDKKAGKSAKSSEATKANLILGASTQLGWTDASQSSLEIKYVGLDKLKSIPVMMGLTLYFQAPLAKELKWSLFPIYKDGKKGSLAGMEIGSLSSDLSLWNGTFPEEWELANLDTLQLQFEGSSDILPELPDGGGWLLVENLDTP